MCSDSAPCHGGTWWPLSSVALTLPLSSPCSHRRCHPRRLVPPLPPQPAADRWGRAVTRCTRTATSSTLTSVTMCALGSIPFGVDETRPRLKPPCSFAQLSVCLLHSPQPENTKSLELESLLLRPNPTKSVGNRLQHGSHRLDGGEDFHLWLRVGMEQGALAQDF